jgi:hypothetical protein
LRTDELSPDNTSSLSAANLVRLSCADMAALPTADPLGTAQQHGSRAQDPLQASEPHRVQVVLWSAACLRSVRVRMGVDSDGSVASTSVAAVPHKCTSCRLPAPTPSSNAKRRTDNLRREHRCTRPPADTCCSPGHHCAGRVRWPCHAQSPASQACGHAGLGRRTCRCTRDALVQRPEDLLTIALSWRRAQQPQGPPRLPMHPCLSSRLAGRHHATDEASVRTGA